MSLFNLTPPDADQGYLNIRAAVHPIEAEIKARLDELWERYEPYADTNFRQEFALRPDDRFWEMYLTISLLDAGKRVCPRSERATGNQGPDIKVVEDDGTTIWIEAMAPGPGDTDDAIPEITPLTEGGEAQSVPKRQVELRISSALLTKRNAFQEWREQGLVDPTDLLVVAISGCRFFAQSASTDLPRPVSVVYPFGDEFVTFDRNTFEVVDSGYHHSGTIDRSKHNQPIPRTAFLSDQFTQISGLIWSRRTMGSCTGDIHDLVFVHNIASERPFPRQWLDWFEEDVVIGEGDDYQLERVRRPSHSPSQPSGAS